MKKNFKFLALTAMAGMAATAAMATPPTGVYPAYAENFNALVKVEDAGVFYSKSGAGLWSLASPEEGNKAFQFYNTTNARNFYMFWGTEGWDYANSKDAGTNNFYMSMDLTITVGNNNDVKQRNTEFCVFTEPDASHPTFTKNSGNGNFTVKATNEDGSYKYDWQGSNDNWVFDLTEIVNYDVDGTTIISATTPMFAVNGDTANTFALTSGQTYFLELTIDSVARKVSYLLTNKTDGTTALEGVRDIPAGVHQLPTGIYCNAGRYNSNLTFDNIMVGKAVDKQVPQTPSIAYSTQGDAVSGTTRGFQIYCLEGETIHYEFRNGATGENLDGIQGPGTINHSTIKLNENIVYVTNSGTLVAWTEIGADKSKETSFEVVCEEVVLPTPECKIVGVKDGYAKSYQVTIDNSSVVTNPNIMFEYTFTDADGKEVTVPNNASGSIIELDKKGTLKLTSMLYGFTNSATVTIENNIEYECTKVIDFEHMTPEQMEAKGFVQQDDWVGPYSEPDNKNRWVQIGFAMSVNVCSNGVDTAKYHIVSGQEYVDPLTVQRYQLEATSATIDSATACSLFAPLVLPSANLSSPKVTKEAPFQIIKNMGLMINATNAGSDIPFAFRGLTDDQYALVYKINSYGRYQGTNYVAKGAYSSFEEAAADQHGILSHVIKGNGSFNLYRYDTVITRIEIMSAKAGSPISDLRVDLEDPNAPIYNLQGILMDCSKESLPKGIYLQNGKKFLVK